MEPASAGFDPPVVSCVRGLLESTLCSRGRPNASVGGGLEAAPYSNAADLAAVITAVRLAAATCVAPPSPAAGANDVSKLAIRVASRTAVIIADEFSDGGAPAKLTAELLPLSALASAFAASRNVPESPAVCIATTLPRRGGGDGANGSSFRSPSRAEDALSRKSPFLPSEEDFRFFPGDGANGSSFTSFNFDRSTHPTSFNILSDIRAACSGDRAFDMSANAARMSRTSDVRAASPSDGR